MKNSHIHYLTILIALTMIGVFATHCSGASIEKAVQHKNEIQVYKIDVSITLHDFIFSMLHHFNKREHTVKKRNKAWPGVLYKQSY